MIAFLAAISQRRVAAIVVLALLLGWVIYLISTARRTYEPGNEVEIAPNRKPYYDDDVLEGPRLTRYLWWAFAMLAVLAVGLPAYWLREPFRQQGAGFDRGTKYFENKAIQRGEELFQASPGDPPTPREPHFGCENCHGKEGVGGVAQYTLSDPANPEGPTQQVQWAAPALNTVMLRYRPEEVEAIIVYGRPQTPMPAWGVAGGGPMNDQQVDDLVAYLTHIALDPDEVKKRNMEQFGTDGARLFGEFCARCHTQGAAYGQPESQQGGGAYGPALIGGSTLRQFPAPQLHYDWVAETAPLGKAYGVRGISSGRMPFFGQMLTQEQIQAVVDYERSL